MSAQRGCCWGDCPRRPNRFGIYPVGPQDRPCEQRDATFFGRDVHNLDGDYRTIHADVVFELTLRYIAYSHLIGPNAHGAFVVSEDEPQQQSEQEYAC